MRGRPVTIIIVSRHIKHHGDDENDDSNGNGDDGDDDDDYGDNDYACVALRE